MSPLQRRILDLLTLADGALCRAVLAAQLGPGIAIGHLNRSLARMAARGTVRVTDRSTASGPLVELPHASEASIRASVSARAPQPRPGTP